MIDIHCHILPGMDDGAKDMEEALKMARQAIEDGITDIICTPHMQNGLYNIRTEKVLPATAEFQEVLNKNNIPLRVHPGAEIHIHPLMMENLDNRSLLTLGNLNKYVLLELPAVSVPDYTKFLISELLLNGIVPIIAHPERNIFFRENLHHLVEMMEQGAITQVNAGSLLGQMGQRIKKFTRELLNNRMVHVLASDGHNEKTRRVVLSEGYMEVGRMKSETEAELLKENAKAILNGDGCKVLSPLNRKKHWIYRWFL